MDFTDTHPHSSSANLCYSPGSSFLAYITGDSSNSVIVCRSDTLQIANQWDFGEYGIQQLQWSDDGLFLHATNLIHGIIFVLSPDPQRRVSDGSDDDEGWLARLESGYEGMAAVTWAPVAGPPVVLAFSMHQLRFTAYDLANQGVTIFQNPKKAKILRAIKLPSIFSVLEVHNEIDHISIYRFKPHTGLRPSADEVSGWVTDHSFPIATNDAQEVSWAPDGNHFAVSENILEYKVVVYTLSGSLRATLGPEGPDGTHISVTIPSLATSQGSRTAAIKGRSAKGKAKDEVEEPSVASGGLGVRCMAWHPSGQMLAIGGYDEHLRILESEFWGLWSSLDISTRVIDHGDNTSPQLHVFREPSAWMTEADGKGIISYQESSLPVTLQHVRPDFSKPNPKAGILWMEWNEDGTLLACRNESLPTSIFIFHLPRASRAALTDTARSRPQPKLLTVLMQSLPIKSAVWRPRHYGNLYICCGGPAVYSWRARSGAQAAGDTGSESIVEQQSECIAVPSDDEFAAIDVRWSPDGQKLMVIGRDSFCCAIDVKGGATTTQ